MPALIMLGPQNQQLNLRAALDLLGIASRVGVITAGWRDAEGDIKELEVHIGRPVIDLMLYQRANEVFARDEPFFRAHRERQNRIKELQRLYRLRLRPMSAAAYSLLSTESDSHLLRSHERAAIAQIRALDRQHLKLIQGLHEAFEREWRPSERPGLTDHRESLEQAVAACDALLIAGGHVAVLMNRMRLFGMKELLRDRAIIAWSAGAMVLGERIVVVVSRIAGTRMRAVAELNHRSHRHAWQNGPLGMLHDGFGCNDLLDAGDDQPGAARDVHVGDIFHQVAFIELDIAQSVGCVGMDQRNVRPCSSQGGDLPACKRATDFHCLLLELHHLFPW